MPQNHDQRDDLTGEHKIGDIGQIVIVLLFAVIWIADTFFLSYTTYLNQYIHLAIRIPCGAVVLIIAGYLARKSTSIVFGEKREVPAVIRKGVFGVIRHPMYLSEILLYLGLLIMSMSLAALGVWIIAIGFLYYICRYEEKLLVARFGEDYERYMQEVPMCFPRLWKK